MCSLIGQRAICVELVFYLALIRNIINVQLAVTQKLRFASGTDERTLLYRIHRPNSSLGELVRPSTKMHAWKKVCHGFHHVSEELSSIHGVQAVWLGPMLMPKL